MTPSQLARFLPSAIEAAYPVCITGAPGIGKTDIVVQACDKLKYTLLVCHPAVDEPINYKGLPSFNDGEVEFLPYGNRHDRGRGTDRRILR